MSPLLSQGGYRAGSVPCQRGPDVPPSAPRWGARLVRATAPVATDATIPTILCETVGVAYDFVASYALGGKVRNCVGLSTRITIPSDVDSATGEGDRDVGRRIVEAADVPDADVPRVRSRRFVDVELPERRFAGHRGRSNAVGVVREHRNARTSWRCRRGRCVACSSRRWRR